MQTVFVLISAAFVCNAVAGDEENDSVLWQIIDKVMDASCKNAALKDKVEICYDSLPKWMTQIIFVCLDEPYMTGKKVMDDYCETENNENEGEDDDAEEDIDEEEEDSDEILECVTEKSKMNRRNVTEDETITILQGCRRIEEHAEEEGLIGLFKELKKQFHPDEEGNGSTN